jgi:hypothetical protein
MTNTLTFHRIQYVLFSGTQRDISHADMCVDGVTHGITAGVFFDKIIVDEGRIYFVKKGDFYYLNGEHL